MSIKKINGEVFTAQGGQKTLTTSGSLGATVNVQGFEVLEAPATFSWELDLAVSPNGGDTSGTYTFDYAQDGREFNIGRKNIVLTAGKVEFDLG